MFSTSVLHDAIAQHRPLEEIEEILSKHPEEICKLDSRTRMNTLQHPAFRGRLDVLLLVLSKIDPEKILECLEMKAADHEKSPLAKKTILQLARESHHELIVIVLKMLGAKDEKELEEIDPAIFRGLLFWMVIHLQNSVLFSLLEKHLEKPLFPKTASVPLKDIKAVDQKQPLLEVSVKIDSKKINTEDFKADLCGLLELSAQQKKSDIALQLFSLNQNEYRVGNKPTSLSQWLVLNELKPVLEFFNDDKNDLKAIETPLATTKLSDRQELIYQLIKTANQEGLKKCFSQNAPVATLPKKEVPIDDKAKITPPKPNLNLYKIQQDQTEELIKDFIAVLYHAYQARDFVAIRTAAYFLANTLQIHTLPFVRQMIKDNHRDLFFIIIFSTPNPNDFAQYHPEILSDMSKLSRIPDFELGMLSQIIDQGTFLEQGEPRDILSVTEHKQVLREAKITVDDFIAAYSKIKLQPKLLHIDFSTITNEATLVQKLKEHKLLATHAPKILKDALRFGIALKDSAFTRHLKKPSNFEILFRSRSSGLSLFLLGYLDARTQTSTLSMLSTHSHEMSYSLSSYALNKYLNHLNQTVLNWGLLTRYKNLSFGKKATIYGVSTTLAATGWLINTLYQQNNLVSGYGIDNPCVTLIDSAQTQCDNDLHPVNLDCTSYCNELTSLYDQMIASATIQSTGWFFIFAYLLLKCDSSTPSIFREIYQALFNDVTNKPIEYFSKDFPLRAKILLKDLKKIKPNLTLTEQSTVTEFRTELGKLRLELPVLEAQQRLFNSAKKKPANRDSKDMNPTPTIARPN